MVRYPGGCKKHHLAVLVRKWWHAQTTWREQVVVDEFSEARVSLNGLPRVVIKVWWHQNLGRISWVMLVPKVTVVARATVYNLRRPLIGVAVNSIGEHLPVPLYVTIER